MQRSPMLNPARSRAHRSNSGLTLTRFVSCIAVGWGKSVGSLFINWREARFQVGRRASYTNHLFVMLGLVRCIKG